MTFGFPEKSCFKVVAPNNAVADRDESWPLATPRRFFWMKCSSRYRADSSACVRCGFAGQLRHVAHDAGAHAVHHAERAHPSLRRDHPGSIDALEVAHAAQLQIKRELRKIEREEAGAEENVTEKSMSPLFAAYRQPAVPGPGTGRGGFSLVG